MKRCLNGARIRCVMLAALFCVASATAQEEELNYSEATVNVHLRSSAPSGLFYQLGDVNGVVKKGEKVEVIDRKSVWTMFRTYEWLQVRTIPETGEPKYREACSANVLPMWRQVMILLNLTASNVRMSAVDASLANMPKGNIAIVNYTPVDMKFRFGSPDEVGGSDHIYDISAYGTVKIPLRRLNENKRAKVQAVFGRAG